MLKIEVPEREAFNPETNEFFTIKGQTLTLEHSLVSLSKWESKWETSFLSASQMTREQTIDYIRCMTITPNVDPIVYYCLTEENIRQVYEYIAKPMTATTFSKREQKTKSRQIMTAELIYYAMIAYQVPFECQKWHLNRLLTLLHVCEIKNQPPKKMSKKELASQNRSLNAARRAKLNSRG